MNTITFSLTSRALALAFPLLLTACGGGSDNTSVGEVDSLSYAIVGTNQILFYDNRSPVSAPSEGLDFYGQNAFYPGNAPAYQDNGDGTTSDLVSGLMWQKSPDMNYDGFVDAKDKLFLDDALAQAASFKLAGYGDWRLPTIKELYSLIQFNGAELSPESTSSASAFPFIDIRYFGFGYGDLSAGDRLIDAQFASSTEYVSTTMEGNRTMFGVNFADGRIKGYPAATSFGKKYYIRYVRGNADYGKNEYADNADGTITDKATGLMWMKNDNGSAVSWQDALSYAEKFEYAGHTDWRLPDAKELQSLVDYTRSPATHGSAAIDPLFQSAAIVNEAGETDYPCYWSSTTFSSTTPQNGSQAVYVAFGRAMGFMNGKWIDVHGAGAQRSDPKEGDASQFPNGHGPQGDAIRIKNHVRLVRTEK